MMVLPLGWTNSAYTAQVELGDREHSMAVHKVAHEHVSRPARRPSAPPARRGDAVLAMGWSEGSYPRAVARRMR